MTISLEKIFFTFILNNKHYYSLVPSHYFKNLEIKFVYNVIRKYIIESDASIPSPKQIWEMIQLEDSESMITKEVLKSMLTLNLTDYDEEKFITPRFNAWILSNKLKDGAVSVVDETRSLETLGDFQDTINIANKIKDIIDTATNTNFLKNDDLGSDFDDPLSHSQDSSIYKVDTGFPTINHMLGKGWDRSSLNIIMAETNGGKCFFGSGTISIKNKLSNKIETIKIENFLNKIKNKNV